MSGNPNATYLTIAYDLSDVLDDGDNFRILPVIGKGGGQNIRDVRFLKGIDLGITQSIILNEFRASNEIGNIDDKIDYIAKLFNEEMHVVVRADSGITSLEQLNGKKVNFSDIGSGSQLSTRDIFRRLGIKAEEVNMGQADALEKLKSGELAATMLIAGKPTGADGQAAGRRRISIPAGAVRKTAAGRLSAGGARPRRLSRHGRGRPRRQHDRGQRGAHRLQLAAGFGSLPPHRQVRRRVFPETRANCRSRRIIRNGARPISPPCCRAGRDSRPPKNGSTAIARNAAARRQHARAVRSIPGDAARVRSKRRSEQRWRTRAVVPGISQMAGAPAINERRDERKSFCEPSELESRGGDHEFSDPPR